MKRIPEGSSLTFGGETLGVPRAGANILGDVSKRRLRKESAILRIQEVLAFAEKFRSGKRRCHTEEKT
jgi:hypothetical protein